MSVETSHYYFHSHGEIFDVDERSGYRSNTSHSYSHNAGGQGIMLCLYADSFCAHKKNHGDERGGSSGDDGRRLFRSQEAIHYYFTIQEKVLDMMVEVVIGIIPTSLLPIIKVGLVG